MYYRTLKTLSRPGPTLLSGVIALLTAALAGCSPRDYRHEADDVAYGLIREHRQFALSTDEPFTIEPPSETLRRRLLVGQQLPYSSPVSLGSTELTPIEEWPDAAYLEQRPDATPASPWAGGAGLEISLLEALQIAARNNRDYQSQKELVFETALRLDLERNSFRGIWSAFADSELSRDLGVSPQVSGLENTGSISATRQLQNGAAFAFNLGADLVKLLTQNEASSLGIFGDASISIPLLRGSGRFVVSEPLTQAQRNVVYAIYDFERFKRDFAVRVATDFLGVLEQLDQVQNSGENYRRLIKSTRRARRMSDAGRLPEIQVDQSEQDELRARNRWISARQSYERILDRFKVLLGLPTDAAIQLDGSELENLRVAVAEPPASDEDPDPVPSEELVPPSDEGAGPLELDETEALRIAFERRLDLRIALGRIDDAQRSVVVAADDLRADLTLLGSASAGERRSSTSANLDDGGLRPERGRYAALLSLDLPFERTAERNSYRMSLVDLEQTIRDLQDLEDQIKLEVRNNLRTLLEARESLRIQEKAVRIAERRVESTDLFLQAGRAEIRDVLEAQEDLVSAQNALTSARVQYRVSELELQRDLDVLEVDERGLWREYTPETRDR